MASLTKRVIKNARRRGVVVYGRSAWGNISPVYQWRRKFRHHLLCPQRPADTLWQHISVTRRSTIKADMRVLHSIGMDRFDSGVSYNIAVDHQTGEMGIGQAFDAAGTHTLNDKNIENYTYNQNYVSHAIVFIGMPGMTPTSHAFTQLAKFIAAMIEEGALTKNFDYNPHSMVAFKDCPTDSVRNLMPRIYLQAHRELEQHTGRTPRQRKHFRKN